MGDEPPSISGRGVWCPDCGDRIEWMRPPTLAMLLDGLAHHARTRHGMDVPYDEQF